MANRTESTVPASPGAILPAYRWLASLVAVLVIIQAFLGTRGFFADPDLITMHEMMANAMFLLVVIQTAFAWMLYTKNVIGMIEVGANALVVLLTVAQIGLGYSTRNAENFATTVSLHIPNGVLLMGVSTLVVTLAWRIRTHQSSTTVYS